MEPSITAAKWQDRREAWEQLSTFDAEPNAAALAKENNGAVVDAALDALARWATSGAPVADALAGDPSVVAAIINKGLASSRAATGRRGLAALEAFYGRADVREATLDALVAGLAPGKARGNGKAPAACARALAGPCAMPAAWLRARPALDATVVALSEAASPEARSAAAVVVLAVERADAARGEALVERLKGPARKAVDKLRATGGAPDAAPEPKRVNDENAPPPAAKVVDAPPPPPPGDGGDFAEVLETLGLAEPFDDAFAKLENWLARKDALDAIAGSFVAGDAGRDENLVAAVARVCANDAHAKVRGAAVACLGALAPVVGGRHDAARALLGRLRDKRGAAEARAALDAIAAASPELVFEDGLAAAVGPCLRSDGDDGKKRLPPFGRAAVLDWLAAHAGAARRAKPEVVQDYAALAAADCGDRDAALRGAAVELLGALAARPKADVDKALKGLDKRARAKVDERAAAARASRAAARGARPPPANLQTAKATLVADAPALTPAPPALEGVSRAGDLAPPKLRAALRDASDKTAWKRRKEALEALVAACAKAGGWLDARGDADALAVARELRPRLGDAQPKLRPLACVAAAAWVSRVGPSRDVAARVAAKAGLTKAAVLAALDSARGVKEAALEALGACAGEAPGRPAVARAVAEHVAPHLGAALAGAASPGAKPDLVDWLAARAPLLDASHGGDVAQHLAGPLVALLRDKSKRHRDAARDALRALAAAGALARPDLDTSVRDLPLAQRKLVDAALDVAFGRADAPAAAAAAPKPEVAAPKPEVAVDARAAVEAPPAAPLPAAFDFSATAFEAYAPRPPKPPAAPADRVGVLAAARALRAQDPAKPFAPATAAALESAAAGAWAGLDGLEVAGAVFRCAPAALARGAPGDADLALRASLAVLGGAPADAVGRDVLREALGAAVRGAARLEDSLPHVCEADAPRKLRHQLDALAAAAALHARRADAVAAILDAFRDDALDRLGAGHLAKLLTVALRDDDAFVAALRRGEAEPCLCAASAVLDAVPADAPKLSLDAAKTVVVAALDALGPETLAALAPRDDGPLVALVRLLGGGDGGAPPPPASPDGGRDLAALRLRCASAARAGAAAPAAGGAEKDRIAALRQRLDAHRRVSS